MIRASYLQGSNSYDDKIAIEIGPLLKVDNIILLLLSCVRADVCGSWTFSTPWHSWPKLLSFQFIFWKSNFILETAKSFSKNLQCSPIIECLWKNFERFLHQIESENKALLMVGWIISVGNNFYKNPYLIFILELSSNLC